MNRMSYGTSLLYVLIKNIIEKIFLMDEWTIILSEARILNKDNRVRNGTSSYELLVREAPEVPPKYILIDNVSACPS